MRQFNKKINECKLIEWILFVFCIVSYALPFVAVGTCRMTEAPPTTFGAPALAAAEPLKPQPDA